MGGGWDPRFIFLSKWGPLQYVFFPKFISQCIPSDYFLLLTWEINPAQSSSGPPAQNETSYLTVPGLILQDGNGTAGIPIQHMNAHECSVHMDSPTPCLITAVTMNAMGILDD